MRMHADQVDVDLPLAGRLLDEQFPAWSDRPLRAVPGAGTVNTIVRIGDDLAARFPLRGADPEAVGEALRREHAAAAELHAHAPVPTPLPLAIGEPGFGYPLPWSVQTWVPGETVTPTSHAASTGLADDLFRLMTALRTVDVAGRPFGGRGRGGLIASHDAWVGSCLRESEGLLDVVLLAALWDEVRELAPPSAPVMTHGDLIPGNVLGRADRLAGVLDGGGLGPTDPALDLVAAWHLLDAGPRRRLREHLGGDDAEWDRGRAWALEQSLGLVWYYRATNPAMSALGVSTLRRLVDDRHPGRPVARPSSPIWGLPGLA